MYIYIYDAPKNPFLRHHCPFGRAIECARFANSNARASTSAQCTTSCNHACALTRAPTSRKVHTSRLRTDLLIKHDSHIFDLHVFSSESKDLLMYS